MNIHIGSWTVPLLFSIGLFLWTAKSYHSAKERGVATAATAARHGLNADRLAEAAVLFFLLLRFSTLALIGWLLWALLRPLHCGI